MQEAPLSFRQAEEENVISGHPIAAETTSTPGNADERSVERIQEEVEEVREESNSTRVVNIDEMPIASKKKTFEELLEENLK